MLKRLLAALLSAMMVLSLATACQSGGGESSASGSPESSSAASSDGAVSSETGGVDLSKKRELTIVMASNNFITDYNNNDLTQELEKEFNCDITIDNLPAGADALSKLQLMINSGEDLGDVVANNISSALRYQYGVGGTFIPLNDYFESDALMPNFRAIESEEDKMRMMGDLMSADGNIYSLPTWEPSIWNMTTYRLYMNMRWLENLGLEVPKTTDELKDVLVHFANDDPNGNGIADEIPLLAQYSDGGYGVNVIHALIHSFQYVGSNMSSLCLSEDGKTVIAPQLTDDYREAMKYLRSLAEAGAIMPDASLAYDANAFKGSLNYQGIGTEPAEEGKSINVVGLFTAGSNTGTFNGSGRDENVNFLEYEMIPVPAGPKGKAYSPYIPHVAPGQWLITSFAEDPDFCVAMGDWFYEPEHSTWVRFGLEDVDWTLDEKACSDWYTQHTKLIEDSGNKQYVEDYYSVLRLRADKRWGENNNVFWHNVQPRYASLETFLHYGDYVDPDNFIYYKGNFGRLSGISKEYYGDAHPQYIMPVISYTEEEQDSITETQVNWPDTVTEWVVSFMSGEKDPNSDADWQEYLNAVESVGLSNYLEKTQAAYERTMYYEANFKK